MTEKTLWIHAGGTKAGSSALQNFFERHYSQLKGFDFAYENRVRTTGDFEINSGNGVWLCDGLSSGRKDSQIDEIVRHYFGGCNNAICSSEYFTMLDSSGWKELFRSSLRLGVKLKVIFYVRNAIPVLQSDYDQAIKVHGESRDFSDWILTADWLHFSTLKLIADEIPTSNILVLSYDRNKTNLLQSFLAAVALDSRFKFDSHDEKRKVNRSLTTDERDLLLQVNKMTGGTFCTELSNFLIYANPTATGEPVSVSGRVRGYLLKRFSHEANWINSAFFESKPVVSVLPIETGKVAETCNEHRNSSEHGDAQQIVLAWAIGKLNTIKTEATIRLLDAVSGAAIKQSEMFRTGVPVDFDPIAYLTLNPDLVEAGVDPFRHFVDHGKSEGRLFKFEDADGSRTQEINALHRRILVLEQLLKQSVIVSKEALRQADVSKREVSYKLALELLQGKAGYFSNWFRRSRRLNAK
jgi:hypothetical protein